MISGYFTISSDAFHRLNVTFCLVLLKFCVLHRLMMYLNGAFGLYLYI